MSTAGGVFVVFEGGDGVGKTTQVDRLCSWLGNEGHDVLKTFEPGDTTVGAMIRQIVLDPATGEMSPRAEALLYAADKAQHIFSVVRPALERGAVVVCDRYVDSMLAYQGAGRVLEPAEVEHIARWATEDLRPDLTVVLDAELSVTVHAKREKDRLGIGRRGVSRTDAAVLPRSWRSATPSTTSCSMRARHERRLPPRWPPGSRNCSRQRAADDVSSEWQSGRHDRIDRRGLPTPVATSVAFGRS